MATKVRKVCLRPMPNPTCSSCRQMLRVIEFIQNNGARGKTDLLEEIFRLKVRMEDGNEKA